MERAAYGSWLSAFPALAAITDAAWQDALAAAQLSRYLPGATVFRAGDACSHYVLILQGSVRLHRVTEQGNEIVLDHVQGGQACELTAGCLVSGANYPVQAIAENDVVALAFPKSAFERALALSPDFRRFVFAHLDQELSHLISLVEEVAFGHIESRLAQCLIDAADACGWVNMTHQMLAAELGTAREVISRALKPMERRGWLRLHRGRVELLDKPAIAALIPEKRL